MYVCSSKAYQVLFKFSFNKPSLESAQSTTQFCARLVHQDAYFYSFPSQILTCFFPESPFLLPSKILASSPWKARPQNAICALLHQRGKHPYPAVYTTRLPSPPSLLSLSPPLNKLKILEVTNFTLRSSNWLV